MNVALQRQLRSGASALAFNEWGFCIVETAGGVLSPGPSGTPQADIYRPLRLPAVLVGDHKLGGIASTISAAESLIMRGYDLDAVVCFDDQSKYQNAEYLKRYFYEKLRIPVYTIPWIPHDINSKDKHDEETLMRQYYSETYVHLGIQGAASRIYEQHRKRTENLESMASRTHQTIWHPFTQHKHVEKPDDVLVFDSAYGDYFQVKSTSRSGDDTAKHSAPMLYAAFDGSASWWTQGNI